MSAFDPFASEFSEPLPATSQPEQPGEPVDFDPFAKPAVTTAQRQPGWDEGQQKKKKKKKKHKKGKEKGEADTSALDGLFGGLSPQTPTPTQTPTHTQVRQPEPQQGEADALDDLFGGAATPSADAPRTPARDPSPEAKTSVGERGSVRGSVSGRHSVDERRPAVQVRGSIIQHMSAKPASVVEGGSSKRSRRPTLVLSRDPKSWNRRREDSITGMFKKPKIMVEWQFVWKTVPHTITVTHSVFRGKKTIVIDGKERYKGKTFGGGDVSMPFLVDSANDVMTAAEVAIIFKGKEHISLHIEGQDFAAARRNWILGSDVEERKELALPSTAEGE